MSKLPNDKTLPVHLLAQCFNNTSSTYKYYWLLSIIQCAESGNTLITKKELFVRMVSSAWYTVNYFHISFGKQDKLQRAIQNIQSLENLTVDLPQEVIINKLLKSKKQETNLELDYFNNQVPHWFLSPWFPKSTPEEIYNNSKEFRNNCPYALHAEFIQVNLSWINYFIENAALLKDFCYWNLSIYLQAKNPSIPDIPHKIIKPAIRNSLTKQRKNYWDIIFNEDNYIKCIYTGKNLTIDEYAVEHFVPYNFVSHDLIWNLIPADKRFNSIKSDKLPIMERFFIPYFELHKRAIEIIIKKQPRNKYLEEYLTIFPDINEIETLSTEVTASKFKDKIQPLITIAHNNGFDFMQ